jgi:ParB-like chromosome segregation protein Spo0J
MSETDQASMHGIRDEIADLAVPVEQLVPFPGNARRGDVAGIMDSLRMHGQYKPLQVRAESGEILVGNHTYAAALELGWTHVAVTYVRCSDEQAKRIVLVDNKAPERGGYDDHDLAALLEGLQDTDAGLAGTGFEREEVTDLLASLNPPDLDALAAEHGEPKDGDLYPLVSIRVPPQLFAAWRAHVDTHTGDEPAAFAALLDIDMADVG